MMNKIAFLEGYLEKKSATEKFLHKTIKNIPIDPKTFELAPDI